MLFFGPFQHSENDSVSISAEINYQTQSPVNFQTIRADDPSLH